MKPGSQDHRDQGSPGSRRGSRRGSRFDARGIVRKFVRGITADVRITGGGTIYLLTGISEQGRRWIEDHIDPSAITIGEAIAVEHRYIGAIVTGMRADGIRVASRIAG